MHPPIFGIHWTAEGTLPAESAAVARQAVPRQSAWEWFPGERFNIETAIKGYT